MKNKILYIVDLNELFILNCDVEIGRTYDLEISGLKLGPVYVVGDL